MKIELKSNPVGQVYFPKSVRKEWGEEYELLPDASGGIIFPKGRPLPIVLKSMKILERGIQHRIKIAEKEEKTNAESLAPKKQ